MASRLIMGIGTHMRGSRRPESDGRLDKPHHRPRRTDYAAFAKVNNVLPMPDDYTAPKPIFANALRTLLIPRLLALSPVGAVTDGNSGYDLVAQTAAKGSLTAGLTPRLR